MGSLILSGDLLKHLWYIQYNLRRYLDNIMANYTFSGVWCYILLYSPKLSPAKTKLNQLNEHVFPLF